MNVLITLTTAGADTGPFNLYSNTDSYVTAFAASIAKSALLAGYTSTVVPAGTSTIRVKSTGVCTNYVDLDISGIPTTTTTTTVPGQTTTTTTTVPGQTTTTTTTVPGETTTTTTTVEPTTTTTTTAPGSACYIYNGQNNNVDDATIFWTNCDGSPGSEVVAPSAFSSNFCAQYGTVSGFNFTINTIEPCSLTTTTTTAAPTTTTTTTIAITCTLYQNNEATDVTGVNYTTCAGDVIVGATLYGTDTGGGTGQSICAQDGTLGGSGAAFLTNVSSCS
jgi:hypothetical protein